MVSSFLQATPQGKDDSQSILCNNFVCLLTYTVFPFNKQSGLLEIQYNGSKQEPTAT